MNPDGWPFDIIVVWQWMCCVRIKHWWLDLRSRWFHCYFHYLWLWHASCWTVRISRTARFDTFWLSFILPHWHHNGPVSSCTSVHHRSTWVNGEKRRQVDGWIDDCIKIQWSLLRSHSLLYEENKRKNDTEKLLCLSLRLFSSILLKAVGNIEVRSQSIKDNVSAMDVYAGLSC